LGAVVGAALGFLRRQRPDPRYARAAEAENAILLAVRARATHEAELAGRSMEVQGGRGVRIEARPA
jgi:hypothetical protein